MWAGRVGRQAGHDIGRAHERCHGVGACLDKLIDPVGDDEVAKGQRVREEAGIDEVLLDLVDGLALIDDEPDLAVLGPGRLAEAIAQLRSQEIGHDGHTDDAGIVLEEACDGRSEHRAGEDPAAHDEDGERDDDEGEPLPRARVGAPLTGLPKLPALDDADSLTASRALGRGPAHGVTGLRSTSARASISACTMSAAASRSIRARLARRAGAEGGPPARPREARPSRAPAAWLVSLSSR